jgi:hypothetical protein
VERYSVSHEPGHMVVYEPQMYGAAARETTPSPSDMAIHAYLHRTARS